MKCSGLVSEKCDSTGAWQVNETCPFVCSGAGVCTGSCVSGTMDCSGDVPRSCVSGSWVSGTACPFVCTGAGQCTGSCVPTSMTCVGNQTDTCNASGDWNPPTSCPSVAGATPTCGGAGVCGFTCNAGFADCDGNAANGCEVNLNSDGVNCGSCGHSCGGGACSNASGTPTCQSQTLGGSFTAEVTSFTVNAGTIYWGQIPSWGSSASGSIDSMSAAGGPMNVVATQAASGSHEPIYYPNDVQVAGTSGNLYWSTVAHNCSGTCQYNAAFWEFAGGLAGSLGGNLSGGAIQFMTVVSDNTALWSDGVHVRNGNSIQVDSNAGMKVAGLASDGTNVYWTDSNANVVMKELVTAKSTHASSIASTGSKPSMVVVNGGNVYWTEPGAVKTVGVNGGTVSSVLSGRANSILSFVVDATNIYWLEKNVVYSMPLAGGAITTLFSTSMVNAVFLGPKIDASNVYVCFLNIASNTAQFERIVKNP